MADVIETAAAFVHAISTGDTDTAHKMLSHQLASDVAASELLAEFEALAEDMGGVTGIGQPMVILETWPEMPEEDRAIVYVSLEGDVFSEAITVTVSEYDHALVISSIEWGRP
jgi:hypothetical protein